jgi:uncharacterized protein YjbJ (UPF0337 family)
MSKFREKVQGLTKQTVGQMIGDHSLAEEGREQQQKADMPAEPDNDNSNENLDRSSPRREDGR